MNMEFKEITKSTILPKPHIFDWDVVINGKPYTVGRFEGYIHSIESRYGAESINNLYCWPRGEDPTYENISEYNMPQSGPVNWGIRYTDDYEFYKGEVRAIGRVTITRNNVDFYTFAGSMNSGIDHARCIIEKLQEDVISWNSIDYENELLAHSCYYKEYKAKITRWIINQGCIIIEPDEEDPIRAEEARKEWIECSGGNSIKLDIIEPCYYTSTGFSWFIGLK